MYDSKINRLISQIGMTIHYNIGFPFYRKLAMAESAYPGAFSIEIEPKDVPKIPLPTLNEFIVDV